MEKSDYLEKSKTYKGFHYSVLDPEMLEYLHRRTLEMFVEIKRIFEKRGIRYMICGGTLLGGITHGGFIPWDDDFDVCIFEEDYEYAIDCLTDSQNGLPKGMVLQCSKTDPNYYLGWMKVRDQYSHTYPDAPQFQENGVWIDLYKLVKAQKKDVPVIIAQEEISYLDRRFAAKGITIEEYENRIQNRQLLEKLENAKKTQKAINGLEKNVYIIWSASKIILEEAWIEPLRRVFFEGMEMTTFGKAEEYLKRHYGDLYSELPPDELRRIGITKIERLCK